MICLNYKYFYEQYTKLEFSSSSWFTHNVKSVNLATSHIMQSTSKNAFGFYQSYISLLFSSISHFHYLKSYKCTYVPHYNTANL